MQLDCPALDCFVPDGESLAVASQRTTQLGIGAHPDDLEIIGIPGILECHEAEDGWFTGVVACDGAGSPRSGRYAAYSNREMIDTRRQEQRAAASLGQYSLQVQLGFPSAEAASPALEDCLVEIVQACQPDTVYLHNIADAHATHRKLARSSLAALRRLPAGQLPARVFGVEVWRSLDWLSAPLRVALPVDDPGELQTRLLRCHDSQVSGGKRYDLAIIARQQANATLVESQDLDACSACVLAMDLAPLLREAEPDIDALLDQALEGFRAELAT
ncbi:MAG: PIG-L family deacetylase [Halieaceae bacterium]|nr:PIG-L family deacetylase [Halieaceae bacterium]